MYIFLCTYYIHYKKNNKMEAEKKSVKPNPPSKAKFKSIYFKCGWDEL